MDAQEVYNETISPIPGEAPPQGDPQVSFEMTPEQIAAAQEMMGQLEPMIGGLAEAGIDRFVYAQKKWSAQQKKQVGKAGMATLLYYMPMEMIGHPLLMLAFAIGTTAIANADPEEQEARKLLAEENEEEEVEEKPKRGRPKKKAVKDGSESTASA